MRAPSMDSSLLRPDKAEAGQARYRIGEVETCFGLGATATGRVLRLVGKSVRLVPGTSTVVLP